MINKIKNKKCPACGFWRLTQGPNGLSCKKCGYTNKKWNKQD